MSIKRLGASFVADDYWAKSVPEHNLDDLIRQNLSTGLARELTKKENADMVLINKIHNVENAYRPAQTKYSLEVNIISPESLRKAKALLDHIVQCKNDVSKEINLIYIGEMLRAIFYKTRRD